MCAWYLSWHTFKYEVSICAPIYNKVPFVHIYIYEVCICAHTYVTGIELRFQNSRDSLCVAVKDDRSEMLTDAQACWHDSTAHAQGFFPT